MLSKLFSCLEAFSTEFTISSFLDLHRILHEFPLHAYKAFSCSETFCTYFTMNLFSIGSWRFSTVITLPITFSSLHFCQLILHQLLWWAFCLPIFCYNIARIGIAGQIKNHVVRDLIFNWNEQEKLLINSSCTQLGTKCHRL